MIRNVPRNYTQPMLFAELVEAIGNAGYNVFMIDYIYMPYDVRQKESSTYVFANVKEAAMIEALSLVVAELRERTTSGQDFVSLPSSPDSAAMALLRSVGEKTETRVSTDASKIDFALLPTPHLSRHAAGGGAPLPLFDS
ncbi:hypothetical protein FOZ63_015323, partial [Perkinsus olseni]